MTPSSTTNSTLETATFGGGCFWCVEAVFSQLKGVQSVTSGYSGGARPNPTYDQVCSGASGHAEVVQVVYDPKIVSFSDLMEVFWATHNPTTLNQQGADRGTQYRSVIFYHNEEQRQAAEAYKAQLEESGVFDKPIVTEISPLKEFYPAEPYHDSYYARQPEAPYCQFVIKPKLQKFQGRFADKMKAGQ